MYEYNVYEEVGVCCTNHHTPKWGIIVGIHKDLQISQHISISHSSLIGRIVAVDVVLGTMASKGFIHRIIGAYTLWNPGVGDDEF
jgi:hypothetical protein